ncbi:L-dopachrome tautomerase-related protein [Pseudoduganella umbonata]|uniref:Gluconolactonase n=1 Tax=Pseudoduganella umbonata TaxID=864828 RepID=A0A4P8HQP7_9BURK|nr:L-dopachrome tautomerase-related protein [Pseudoduganella umbonata]MBB3222594.1 hypothetical protein [Pseudoduganella umbonata]QCP10888.1 hypothetical protein FCL38_10970 [Pseudoduganella umbonata]
MQRILSMKVAAAAVLGAVLALNAGAAQLQVVAQSNDMVWNAVAVDGWRVFVAGPRWTGSKGPAVGLLDAAGKPQPYPDAAWNGWRKGAASARAFVNVNAIHMDGKGSLWVVDSGSPDFGGDPLPHGAKAVQIDLRTNRVTRVVEFGPDVALPGSYVDDIRFNGKHAYLTDAGKPGIIVLDLVTGDTRRVLDGSPATTALADRQIEVAGRIMRGADGKPLRVNADPFELSPDGRHLYFGPLSGPWSQVETRLLDDPTVDAAALERAVKPWADLPPTGGTAMDRHGNLYFSDLKTSSLKKRTPDGRVMTVIQDDRLHWVDAPVIDAAHRIWLPVPQMDRNALFNDGVSRVRWPITLYTLQLEGASQ